MASQTPELMLDIGLLFSFLFHTVIQPKEKIFLWPNAVLFLAVSCHHFSTLSSLRFLASSCFSLNFVLFLLSYQLPIKI